MQYTAGDVRLSYDVRGTGPDLLFMHGLAADRKQAERCLAGLSGFRVITIDMPGHGGSPLSDRRTLHEQVGFRAYARIAGDLLAHLGVTTAYVGGISMGAGVALKLAVAPEAYRTGLVSGLLLVRPAWINAPARPQLDLLSDIGGWIANEGVPAARQRLVNDHRFADIHRCVPACANGLVDTILRPHVAASPAVLAAVVDDRPYESRSDLETCPTPVHVVSGLHDPLHPRWVADNLEAALPNATAQTVPPRYLEPERHARAVADAIQSFLDRCVETGTTHSPDQTEGPT